MQYTPDTSYYPTNPAAAICEYYGVSWDDVWNLHWHVEYEQTVRHVLQSLDGPVVVNLYRMPSGTYEAVTYRA